MPYPVGVAGRAGSTTEALPDEVLMARYAEGDAESFEILFQRYEARAYAYFLRRTGLPDRAQDLYQLLFLRIHRARDRYDPTRPFASWFFEIARRLLLDDSRRAFRAREVPFDGWEPVVEAPSSEDRLWQREALGSLMAPLSEVERYVLIGAKVEGRAYAELAADLERSVPAVRKIASRALQRLRHGVRTAVPVQDPI